MIARVVSTKSKNTAVVIIERQKIHPLYKKAFARSKKYLVDDQIGVKIGDLVSIEKCRPISKKKHWKIIQIVGQNLEEVTKAQLKESAEKVISEVMPEEKEQPSVVSPSDKQKIRKPKSEKRNYSVERKQKTDNRKNKETK
ncbi:30S ribosomal protein S17 [Candidatus Daviesbacteria bacterium]|nr:30S ribosomal protein S17 [Candidatus Daviesbacteria bacterium]